MEEFPDPSGPPYPYKYPLPADAKAEHQRAVRHFRRKHEFWDGLMTASLSVPVAVAGAWFTDADGNLPGSVGVLVVAVGAVLMALIGYRKGVVADERDKHVNLLKTYGVLPHETGESAPAVLHPDFDKIRAQFGIPLPGKEDTSRPIPAATADDGIPGGDPYSGVIRLGPLEPRREIGH
ncbi:hypothetical protein ACFWIW_26995 [Amycolatopsis sp. NPDC058340]|uniref:hypothetical protein n=1 Tax=Amycolatopsis sp. NPDC058340 TaxID=3346453 RepID=UPI0036522F4C